MAEISYDFRFVKNLPNILKRKKKSAQKILDKMIMEDSEEFINSKSGKLANSAVVSKELNEVVYKSNYAKSIFYGKGKSKDWFGNAKSKNVKKWLKIVGDEYGK